jgi:hypothetical protein
VLLVHWRHYSLSYLLVVVIGKQFRFFVLQVIKFVNDQVPGLVRRGVGLELEQN